jgi:hypothetical protein
LLGTSQLKGGAVVAVKEKKKNVKEKKVKPEPQEES